MNQRTFPCSKRQTAKMIEYCNKYQVALYRSLNSNIVLPLVYYSNLSTKFDIVLFSLVKFNGLPQRAFI